MLKYIVGDGCHPVKLLLNVYIIIINVIILMLNIIKMHNYEKSAHLILQREL